MTKGLTSTWRLVKSGVPKGYVLGLLMFSTYINYLPDNIRSTCKIFEDDTSLFPHVLDKDTSHDELNHDLWLFIIMVF